MESVREEIKLLSGIRVVESGCTLATCLTGMLLSDLGADVVRIASEHARSFLHRGKKIVSLQEMQDSERDTFFQNAAAVIIDEFGFSGTEWRQGPKQIICKYTVPQGIQRMTPENIDFHIASLAHLFEPVAGFGKQRPFPFPLPSIMAALNGVNALTAALIGVERFGTGESIEISLQDSAVTLLGLKTIITSGTGTGWSPLQWVASPFTGVRKTADGSVYLHVGLSRHLSMFLDILDQGGFQPYSAKLRGLLDKTALEDPVAADGIIRAFRVNALLSELFRRKSAIEWQSLLCNKGICCMPVGSAESWRNSEWAKENGMVVDDGENGIGPGGAVGVVARGSSKAVDKGEPAVAKRALPLEGLMVADFTNIIAGPFAGRTLAEFGATVVRIENPAPYQYFAEPFHLLFNYGKSSVVMDLQSETGRENLKKFIGFYRPAMVIQNFRAGVGERLGIGFNELEQTLPGLVYLHINAFGNAGPWASYSGFEQTVQAICGIQDTYSSKERPELFPYPVNDMMTGLVGSFGVLAAYYRRLKDKTGVAVATSLAQSGTLLASCATQTPFGTAGTMFREVFRAKDGGIAVTAATISEVIQFACPSGGIPGDPIIALRKAFRMKSKACWQKMADDTESSTIVISIGPCQKSLKEFSNKASKVPVSAHSFPPFGAFLVTGSPVRFGKTGAVTPGKAVARGTDTKLFFDRAGIEMDKKSAMVVPLISKRKSFFGIFATIKWAVYYLIVNRREHVPASNGTR